MKQRTFANCKSLKEIIFEDKTLELIDQSACEGCISLHHLRIPNSVTKIGTKAFYGCNSLVQVCFHSFLQIIGESAFESSGLFGVDISSSFPQITISCFAFRDSTK